MGARDRGGGGLEVRVDLKIINDQERRPRLLTFIYRGRRFFIIFPDARTRKIRVILLKLIK